MTYIIRIFLGVVLSFTFSAHSDRKPDTVTVLTKSLPPAEGSKTLNVISWNVKRLGRARFDFSTSKILDGADIVTFQEVNKLDSGQKALTILSAGMAARTGEKICMALSEVPTGSQERYAYLWKDKRIAYVKNDGTLMDTCPKSAITIRLGARFSEEITREPALGSFYLRTAARQFVLASIHLRPSGKKPQLEVPPLFKTFESIRVPLIVAGDYNLDSTHSAFDTARAAGFKAAMKGVKTSLKMKKRELNKPYDNFWFRDVTLTKTSVINLYLAFPQIEARKIYDTVSDHSPIVAEFDLNRPVMTTAETD